MIVPCNNQWSRKVKNIWGGGGGGWGEGDVKSVLSWFCLPEIMISMVYIWHNIFINFKV